MSELTGWRKEIADYLLSSIKGVDKVFFFDSREGFCLFEQKTQEDFRPVRKFFKLEMFGEDARITRLEEVDFKKLFPAAITGN